MKYRTIKNKAIILCILIAAVVGSLIYVLAKLQINQGEEYREQSENSVTQSVELVASRGDILDRYGRVLVTNETCYNIVISRVSLIRQEDPNAIVLKLIEICDSFGVEHNDTMPVEVKNGVVKISDDDSSGSYYFNQFLDYLEIDRDQPAKAIYQQLLERYEVSGQYTEEQIREIVGVRYELEARSAISMPDYVFAEDVSTDLIAAVNDANLSSISIQTGSKRVYKTEYAAHLLGYTGQIWAEEYDDYADKGYNMNAYVGKEGAEKAFEEYLHGIDGSEVIYTNSDGDITGVAESVEPIPGENVYLTIDINLQGEVERLLADKVTAIRQTEQGQYAEGAAAVVVEVGTGDILACASYPTYNLADFFTDYEEISTAEDSPLLNRALNGLYEPGSTFKLVTATAAMENGIINANTSIYDEGVYKYYEDYQPECWIYSRTHATHGYETVETAIRDSCNYFFFEVGRLTGIDLITKYANLYGLGVSTGIEDGFVETTGTAAGVEEREADNQVWVAGDTLQAAIGQSDNRFTPLQLANYAATLASGGVRYRAHFLSKVSTADYGEVTYEFEPEVLQNLNLSNSTVSAIQEGMREVVADGSVASEFKNLGVTVAGKTGTAQVGKEANNALFICYAPYENPEIAIAVVVEKGISGSTVANVAAEIISAYMNSKTGTNETSPENELLK